MYFIKFCFYYAVVLFSWYRKIMKENSKLSCSNFSRRLERVYYMRLCKVGLTYGIRARFQN
jgi:hypothetical protein